MGLFVIVSYIYSLLTTSIGLYLSTNVHKARAKLQLIIYIRKYVFRNSILAH